MRKYIEIFKYSLKTKLAFIYNYLFSLFSFGIHVFVFNELWDYILKGKSIVGYTKTELIWYIIIAELVTYSAESTYKKIGSMVKQGDIANMLIKPIDIISVRTQLFLMEYNKLFYSREFFTYNKDYYKYNIWNYFRNNSCRKNRNYSYVSNNYNNSNYYRSNNRIITSNICWNNSIFY